LLDGDAEAAERAAERHPVFRNGRPEQEPTVNAANSNADNRSVKVRG
jgi:hypothetical protein